MLLIRFLIISICVLYIIRAVFRLLLPMLFQGLVNKAAQQAQQQQQGYQQNARQEQRRHEGTIKIDHIPQQQKRKGSVPDSEGDFVDYEEIK